MVAVLKGAKGAISSKFRVTRCNSVGSKQASLMIITTGRIHGMYNGSTIICDEKNERSANDFENRQFRDNRPLKCPGERTLNRARKICKKKLQELIRKMQNRKFSTLKIRAILSSYVKLSNPTFS